jgi:hypothetical protein
LPQPGVFDEFLPELFVNVLLNLSYWDLLRVPGVAKNWKNLVESEPTLRVQRFKKASQVYVEAGAIERV